MNGVETLTISAITAGGFAWLVKYTYVKLDKKVDEIQKTVTNIKENCKFCPDKK